MKSIFLEKNLRSLYCSNIKYKALLNKFSLNKASYFGFLNVLKKSNNQETDLERYSKLKSKYSKEKKDEDQEEENLEKVKENIQDQSFLKFLQFLENKETFTWQNNLELMKVKFKKNESFKFKFIYIL